MAKGREGSSKAAGTHLSRPLSARDTTSSPVSSVPYSLSGPTFYSQTSSGKPHWTASLSPGNPLAMDFCFAPFVSSTSVTFKWADCDPQWKIHILSCISVHTHNTLSLSLSHTHRAIHNAYTWTKFPTQIFTLILCCHLILFYFTKKCWLQLNQSISWPTKKVFSNSRQFGVWCFIVYRSPPSASPSLWLLIFEFSYLHAAAEYSQQLLISLLALSLSLFSNLHMNFSQIQFSFDHSDA